MCCGKHLNLPKKSLTTRDLKEIKPREAKDEPRPKSKTKEMLE